MIGIFDSGVGGLSVWREVAACLPDVPIVYLADQAHVPYGSRPLDEVRRLAMRCTGWLIARGCRLIVVACNTASAAALDVLRARFPHRPFVGIEPAVKPAARRSQTGVIAVLATPATFGSQRYADLVARWGSGIRVIQQPCPGWVEAVERWHAMTTEQDRCTLCDMVEQQVRPVLAAGADVLVLGCTHFPFLTPWIEGAIERFVAARSATPLASRPVTIIDPAPAVAQQVVRVWAQLAPQPSLPAAAQGAALPHYEFWTTGSAARFAWVASALLQREVCARPATISQDEAHRSNTRPTLA